ncbi:MAG: hypothetical protein AAGD38_22835, partial [Acidobacteriota bacterium]
MQRSRHAIARHVIVSVVVFLSVLATPLVAVPIDFELGLLWPDHQREFLYDGPGLLLDRPQVQALAAGDIVARDAWIDEFLDDPVPATAENELRDGIEKRKALVRQEGYVSLLDDRAKFLFLHGRPAILQPLDCQLAVKNIEIWHVADPVDGTVRELVFYEPEPQEPWRLWYPFDGKRVLYNDDMVAVMEQVAELLAQGQVRMFGDRRLDRRVCLEIEELDDATGVVGLFGFLPNRIDAKTVDRYLDPPVELPAWASAAAATEVDPPPPLLPAELHVAYPERAGQRLLTQLIALVPPEADLTPVQVGEKEEIRLLIEGQIERKGRVFDEFRVRFLAPPSEGKPIALIAERKLRPNRTFLVRMAIK